MSNWQWYAHAIANAFGSTSAGGAPNIDYLSDTIKVALVASTYTPDRTAHDFWDDVVAHEISGTGYIAGGATLSSKTLTVTAANAFSQTWAASTAYYAGDVVRPTTGNGFLYRAQGSGTSGSSEPTWPTTVGDEVADSGVTWTNVGVAIVQWDAADPSWGPGATFSGARYAVMYDATPSTNATRPLIAVVDFGAAQSVTNGTFTIVFAPTGFLYHTFA